MIRYSGTMKCFYCSGQDGTQFMANFALKGLFASARGRGVTEAPTTNFGANNKL
jgi:hypothetical protein